MTKRYPLRIFVFLMFFILSVNLEAFASNNYEDVEAAKISIYDMTDGSFYLTLNFDNGNMPGQLKTLKRHLNNRLSADTAESIMSYVEKKTTKEYFLPAKYFLDAYTGKFLIAFGSYNFIKINYNGEDYSSTYNKTVNIKDSNRIAGYYVPKKTALKVTAETTKGNTETCFRIDVSKGRSLADCRAQWQDLVAILKQKHDYPAIVDVMRNVDSKISKGDILVDYWIYDERSQRFLYVKASKQDEPYVYVYVCSEKWTKELKKNTKEPYYEIISGFYVTKNTPLSVLPSAWGGGAEIVFMPNRFVRDFDGQLADMSKILMQKCDKKTVDQVMQYITQKKEKIPAKSFDDKKSNGYIYVDKCGTSVHDLLIMYGHKK